MKKIAILGCGQLGSIVADAIASSLLPDYTLCAAMSRKLPDAEALCAKAGGAACVTLDEVLAQKPDYVVETAAVQVAKESCLPVLFFRQVSKAANALSMICFCIFCMVLQCTESMAEMAEMDV